MKKSSLFIRATGRAIAAFFKAYDSPIRMTDSGHPILAGWEKLPEGLHPYEVLQRGIENPNVNITRCAFVFATGKMIGEVTYLAEGTYTLGTACTNSIVITTPSLTERRLSIVVGPEKVTLSSDAPDAPLMINGNIVKTATLVDQDECVFSEATFFYQELKA